MSRKSKLRIKELQWKGYHGFIVLVVLLIPMMLVTSGLFAPGESNVSYAQAKVLTLESENLVEDTLIKGLMLGEQQLQIQILSGDFENEKIYIKNGLSRLYNVKLNPSDTFIVKIQRDGATMVNCAVYNYNRLPMIVFLAVFFFIVIIGLGGWSGVRAILSLVFTLATIVYFMLPLIFKGYDPIIISMITVALTAVVSLILISHWHLKTAAALIGTLAGVFIAGLIAYIVGNITHLSGLTMEEAEELIYLAGDQGVKIHGLMFASILISSLGAVMDTAMSIAATVFEIGEANKNLNVKELYSSGMKVGKDMMGTMTTTLILAFTGGALNLLILIVFYKMPGLQIASLDGIATEVVLGLSGSIGIALTVPLTAYISAVLARK